MGAPIHHRSSFPAPSMCSEPWTVERVNVLRRMWAAGDSAASIARTLGGVTRNAVIGKASRLGLSGRANNPPHTPQRRRQTQPYKPPKPKRIVASGGGGAFRAPIVARRAPRAPEPEPATLDVLDIPFSQRKTLIELTEHTCRWPVGDPEAPDFFFCGGDVAGDAVYCAYHCRVAYHPTRDRRREAGYHRWLERSV